MMKEEAEHVAYVLNNLKNHAMGEMKNAGNRSYALAMVDQEDIRCLEYAVKMLEEKAKEGET